MVNFDIKKPLLPSREGISGRNIVWSNHNAQDDFFSKFAIDEWHKQRYVFTSRSYEGRSHADSGIDSKTFERECFPQYLDHSLADFAWNMGEWDGPVVVKRNGRSFWEKGLVTARFQRRGATPLAKGLLRKAKRGWRARNTGRGNLPFALHSRRGVIREFSFCYPPQMLIYLAFVHDCVNRAVM